MATRARYDLLVIGGGINGLGIASDASQRGLSVLIVEKGDWGGGTTSASSRLIHGGLRYLQYGEIDLVRESLHERGILARQRPHLVHPISLLIPTFRGQPVPRWMIGVGLLMYDVLAHDPLFPHPSILSLKQTEEQEPGLTHDGLTGGYRYPDGQVEFPERLCVELRNEAQAAGGEARSYTRVVALKENGKRLVTGAVLHDEFTGESQEIEAGLTINAAGPWLDAINRTLGTPPPPLIGGTWGTHLILPTRPEGPKGSLYATARRDGRPFFLLPWDHRLLVGTTDVRFQGSDPDQLKIEDWEVQYLLDETNHLFPGAQYTREDVQATTVGIRPLPASDKKTGAVTRRHYLVDHQKQNGIGGLGSIVGGKLTTYRSLAEDAVDWALRQLGRPPVPCPTGKIDGNPSVSDWTRDTELALVKLGLPSTLAPRFVGLYGPKTNEVLKRVEADASLGQQVAPDVPVLAAQVVHAVESEGARTVEDIVRRRLMLLPVPEAALDAVLRICRERQLPIKE